MRLPVRLLLVLIFLLSACSAPTRIAGQFQVRPSATPTATPTVSPSPLATSTPSLETLLLSPTPTAQPLPTRVVDAPEPQPNDTPAPSLIDQYLPRREQVAETEHFIFYAQDDYFPVDQAWWIAEAEVVYDYVSQRVDYAEIENKIQFAFMAPEQHACPVRGLASHERAPMVLIYADEQSPREYLLAVLAHELGHAIPSEGFPGGLPDDQALTEGLATWASGSYWNEWKNVPSLDALIRQYIRAGEYESIYENHDLHGIYPWQTEGSSSEDCLARRDKIYSEWGSFTGYLIETYGWEKAHRLFDSPDPVRTNDTVIHFPPDYEGVYGKSLNQLEFEWLEYLLGYRLDV